jgi:hypothetical protein
VKNDRRGAPAQSKRNAASSRAAKTARDLTAGQTLSNLCKRYRLRAPSHLLGMKAVLRFKVPHLPN